jgi:hypothetical protein
MTVFARLAQGPSNHPRPWIVLLDYQGAEGSDDHIRLEFIRRDGTELTPDDCKAIRANSNVKDGEAPEWLKRITCREFLTKEEALEIVSRADVTLVDRLPWELSL